MPRTAQTPLLALALAAIAAPAFAAPALAAGELNLYSSRHYDTDERLYTDFEEMTGITINRIEGNADELIARMQAEGANSPADVLLTVDTSRLKRAKDAGVLAPVESPVLEARIPAYIQDADNTWFGFSQRARIIFYDKDEVTNPPRSYEALADPQYAGQVCIRSGTNAYMQTLMAAMIEHNGEEAARDWARGVVANFARAPQGGDTDQLRGIVSGECDIALSNTYYYARSLRTEVDGLSGAENLGWIFPNQDTTGAHMNLSGGGVAAHATNRENAVKFLEYLASEQAQKYFSEGNDEYPAVPGIGLAPQVAALGLFRPDAVDLSAVAENLPQAQRLFNEAGWR